MPQFRGAKLIRAEIEKDSFIKEVYQNFQQNCCPKESSWAPASVMPNNEPHKSGQMVGFQSASHVTVFSSYCLSWNLQEKGENAMTFKKYKKVCSVHFEGSHVVHINYLGNLSFFKNVFLVKR